MTATTNAKKEDRPTRAYYQWRRPDKKYQREITRDETAHRIAYFVPSMSTPNKVYEVTLGEEESCQCGAFRLGGHTCCHLYLASFYHAKIGRKNQWNR